MNILSKLLILVTIFLGVDGYCLTDIDNVSSSVRDSNVSWDFSKKRILVLNAYHQNYHWADQIMSGVLSELGNKEVYELYIEYMDTKRCSDSLYYKQLKEIYYHKYFNTNIDVILACDDNALNFLLAYRDSIFPNVPVSFCGIVDFHNSRIEGHYAYSGVCENFDVLGNIELIKRNHPDIEQIAVVSDLTESGKALIARVKRAEAKLSDQVGLQYLINLNPKELRRRLKELSANTVIIWAIYLIDHLPFLTIEIQVKG